MATTDISTTKPVAAVIVAAPYAPAGPIVMCTSNSTVQIVGPANYTFEVNETGLGFQPGLRVRASAQTDVTQWIEGLVTSFDGIDLVIAADLSNGLGNYHAWNITIMGEPGKTGAKGDTGATGPQGPAGGLMNPNVDLTGTPTCPVAGATDSSMQIANTRWVGNLLAANYQPLDPDLTSLAAAAAVDVIYYRSASGWAPVTIGTNLTFVSGTLNAVLTATAPIDSPAFTGDPTRVTAPAPGDNDSSIPTTAWVQTELSAYAKLASPTFTGAPKAPTPTVATNDTTIPTTAWVTTKLGGYQPLDADLTGLANVIATGVMVWRKADGDWRPVIMGANIAFDASTGTLNASGGSGGGGGIPEAPTGTGLAYARKDLGWVAAATALDLTNYAPLASPVLSGTPRAPTAAIGTNTDQIATTGYVVAGFAPNNSPSLTGAPTGPTPATADNSTKLATTAYVQNVVVSYAPLVSPALSGTPTAPTPSTGDNSTALATTAFVKAQGYATLASPTLTGDPKAPTPTAGDNDTSIATTAFVQSAVAAGGFTTGDVKLSLKQAADPGWVMMNDGSIGDASSGATTRANADTQALFILIWSGVSDTFAPVSGGRGSSALNDFNAHKKLTLPRALGRALIGGAGGAGLTSYPLGAWGGENTHTPQVGETAPHIHGISDPTHYHPISDPSHRHLYPQTVNLLLLGTYVTVDTGSAVNVATWASYLPPNNDYTSYSGTSATINANYVGFSQTNSNGGGAPFNIMQPFLTLNVMVKL